MPFLYNSPSQIAAGCSNWKAIGIKMTSEQFNLKHHANYDWHTKLYGTKSLVLVIYLLLFSLTIKLLKPDLVFSISMFLLFILCLLINEKLFKNYQIKHQGKHQLFCPECKFDFAKITPNHNKSTILVENNCPNCYGVIVSDLTK
jgi:hypothetical protein